VKSKKQAPNTSRQIEKYVIFEGKNLLKKNYYKLFLVFSKIILKNQKKHIQNHDYKKQLFIRKPSKTPVIKV